MNGRVKKGPASGGTDRGAQTQARDLQHTAKIIRFQPALPRLRGRYAPAGTVVFLPSVIAGDPDKIWQSLRELMRAKIVDLPQGHPARRAIRPILARIWQEGAANG